jgi:hypothetical protein
LNFDTSAIDETSELIKSQEMRQAINNKLGGLVSKSFRQKESVTEATTNL